MKPADEVRRDLVRQWLRKAEDDFELSEHLLAENSPYLGAVGFHAQQAAEKFLKALLTHRQIEFPKTHNIGELLDLLAKADLPLASSLGDASALNPFSVDIRYPGDVPEVTIEEAKTAVELAGKIRAAVRSRLAG